MAPSETHSKTPKNRQTSSSKSSSKSSSRTRRGPKHPGVTLIRPKAESRQSWRARYRHPDTGRLVWETLPATYTNAEMRAVWAVKKSKQLADRKSALERGAIRETGLAVSVAIESFFRDRVELRPATVTTYRRGTDAFAAWCQGAGVRTLDQIKPPKLAAFRMALLRTPKREVISGGRKGAKRDTDALKDPGSINTELKGVKVLLSHLRRMGQLAYLHSDDIADALAPMKGGADLGDFLRPGEIRALLDAATAYDAATYAATRAEHAARTRGSTPRHKPIMPMVRMALLTGMRRAELVELTWQQIDLDAREIRLGSETKTKRGRIITLDESPSLLKLLRALPKSDPVLGLNAEEARNAIRRLREHGAPEKATWQSLRRTCGTYLTCSAGIYGGASAYQSARRLGHSVAVAERHYLGVLRDIPREAATLEAAMGIE